MFLTNKYTLWYYKIISNATNRNLSGYVEKHHVIPKSLGGTDDKFNIVSLTAREHFVCHRLLTKMTEGSYKKKMIHAIWSFTRTSKNQNRIKITSKSYEVIRKEFSNMLSESRKGIMNVGKTPWNKGISTPGRKHTEETKIKMKNSWKKRPPRSKEHSDAISRANTGKKASEETKKKMSATRTGIVPKASFIPFICEHCGKEGKGATNYKRWHGDNCKKVKK